MFVPNYRLEYIFSYTSRLRIPPEIIGPVPSGIRVSFYSISGEAHGPKVKGTFVPARAHWALLRSDGIAILDVRATVQTADGALIHLPWTGMTDLGPDGYERFLRGEVPPRLSLRGVPRFRTSHPSYLWLNRLQCLNVGDADMVTGLVKYDVYAT